MSETSEMYLFEEDPEIAKKYVYDEEFGGKWILFIAIDSMDSMWAKSCKLYRQGQFTGITSIKSSTAKINPRQTTTKSGVIIFHCGPSHDEAKIMSYGNNIVDKLSYYNRMGYIHYKSDAQTAKGTRSTGNMNNSIYRIAVPKSRIVTVTRRGDSSLYPNWRDGEVSTESVPTKVTDAYWLHERNAKIADKYQCERVKSGHWLMIFNRAWLDKAWQKACKLYREDKLTGIHSMRVSTAKQSDGDHKYTGIIMYYCGPSDQLDLVKSYGENLAKLTNYFDKNGRLNYRVDNPKQTLLHVEVPSSWRRREVDDSD